MGAITGTKVLATEFAGDLKTKVFTSTIASSTDTVDLSSYFSTIYYANTVLEGGADAALIPGLQTSFSGTTVTIESFEQDGTPATNWTGANVRLLVLGIE